MRNRLFDIGGDGIVPWACDGALIAENEVCRAACSAYEANAAIWPWSCDNTVITGNTAAFTAKYPGNGDGQGFDVDTNNRNTIVENNLSYQNEGGFILICGEKDTLNKGVIVRNNISVSDGMAIFTLWNNLEDVFIYNNTVYSPDNSRAVYLIANWGKGNADPIQMKKVEFFNNLVATETPLAFRGMQKSWNIHHNLYTGTHAGQLAKTGRSNIVRNPLFSGEIDPAREVRTQLKQLFPHNASGGCAPGCPSSAAKRLFRHPAKSGRTNRRTGSNSMNSRPYPPRFHAPAVFGVRPGSDFFLALPVEGERLSLDCANPPPGTGFDAAAGALSGRIGRPGIYPVEFEAENPAGRSRCTIRLIAGEGIQLTPPMGMEQLVLLLGGRQRCRNPENGTRTRRTRTRRPRLEFREHRRLLAGRARRKIRRDPGKRTLPRHESAGRLHPQPRAAVRPLFNAVDRHLCRIPRRQHRPGTRRTAVPAGAGTASAESGIRPLSGTPQPRRRPARPRNGGSATMCASGPNGGRLREGRLAPERPPDRAPHSR